MLSRVEQSSSTRGRLHGNIPGLVCLLMIAALVPETAITQIYSFEDEEGIVHFTDRPPVQRDEYQVIGQSTQRRGPVRMFNAGSSRDPRWTFHNRLNGPVEIEVALEEAENVLARPSLPRRFTLPPRQEVQPFEIEARDERQGFSYRITSRHVPGEPGVRHDPGVVYLPPFAAGESFPVGQAFGGDFSHNESQNYHAVDITMPVGTPVHAARAGIVMDLERDFSEGGEDRDRYAHRANYIRILHEDGTMAVYAHLDFRGTVIFPGQVVLEGEKIGQSGETGFVTGPHLHFVVQRNAGMKLESVPFRFETPEGPRTPRAGMRLKR